MVINKSNLFTAFALCVLPVFCQAKAESPDLFNRSFYVGAMGGLGSTTWQGLVPREQNQNLAINMSAPINVREGGNVWGFMAGYELSRYFALEANYMHYPSAIIDFDEVSLFSFDHDGMGQFKSETETYSLAAKVMLMIPNTQVRLFSSAGISHLHRQDIILNDWRFSPTFGLGLNVHMSNHLMAELSGNYTAGFGESQLNPTDTYFPFLYSVTARLAYFF